MRALLTVLLSFVFIAAFTAFFLLSSVVKYVEEPDRVVETAARSDLRGAVVELTAGFIADRVAADPTLQTMSELELREIVGGVITQDWLDESLVSSHKAVRGALRDAEATAVLDLRETKLALREALSKLRGRAQANCARLLGADACGSAREARVMVAAFEKRADAAIDEITDEIDLLASLSSDERQKATELREGFESLETIRMLGLVVLIMIGAGIIILNARPFRRLIVATGSIAMISSGIYLLALNLSGSFASEALAKETGDTGDRAATFTARLVASLVEDAVGGSTLPVALIGVAGFVVVTLVLLLSRR